MNSEPAPKIEAPKGGRTALSRLEHPCSHVSPREASYLLMLGHLAESSELPTQASLARAMEVSPPTVLEMMRRLRADGLVEPDRLVLTRVGVSSVLKLASQRYAALLLAREVLGLDDEAARQEAERLAPSISTTLARRLLIREAARESRRGISHAVATNETG